MSVEMGKYAKAAEEDAKTKLRKQMHHDLCVLSAGSAMTSFPVPKLAIEYLVAERAVKIYKELWYLVMKEIP